MTDWPANMPKPTWESKDGSVLLYHADNREVSPHIRGVTSIVTDPPYGLSFMGKDWDHGVPGEHFWSLFAECCLPGAILLAFGGTRTYHRLACAIEDAGWELRDCLQWIYGSGFPKSLDISKAIDKAAGAEREVVADNPHARPNQDGKRIWCGDKPGKEQTHPSITAPATPAAHLWNGYGTALKPAYEPICLAMNPLDGTFANNALTHGVAGLNIDGCRVSGASGGGHWTHKREIGGRGIYGGGGREDIDNGNQGHSSGRFPANVIHDGSDEVVGMFPQTKSGSGVKGKRSQGSCYGKPTQDLTTDWAGDSGCAARFFYCAKASKSERTMHGAVENRHPTVKPLALMRYLVKLTKTPAGGPVFDPFMGSGTTALACMAEVRPFVGCEQDKDSFDTAVARCEALFRQDEHREPDPELFDAANDSAKNVAVPESSLDSNERAKA